MLRDVQSAFFGFCVESGKALLAAMMESERTALCSPKGVPSAQRAAYPMFGQSSGIDFPSMKDLRVSSLQRWLFVSTVGGSFSFLQAVIALVGPVRLRVRAGFARHHLLSVWALLAEHPMLHTPQAGKTNRIRTRRPLYQDGRA